MTESVHLHFSLLLHSISLTVLLVPEYVLMPLYQLSQSTNLWEQRISIVSTLTLVRAHNIDETLTIANILLEHSHDLMQKAVGWLLREVGKIDMRALENFLETHLSRLSATTLRYAIERMPETIRQEWLVRKAILRQKKS